MSSSATFAVTNLELKETACIGVSVIVSLLQAYYMKGPAARNAVKRTPEVLGYTGAFSLASLRRSPKLS